MNESFNGLAIGVVAVTALFALLLIATPPVREYLGRREHRRRMRERDWLKNDSKPQGRRRGKG